ncbi:MAG TPA: hypothetical protein VLL04_03670 [Rhizomicrobium sp.]|nr:hypothetical protein [Rhizomicrobium sp.]
MTLVALLAFFLQSLVVQVHIHPQAVPQQAKSVSHPGPVPLKNQDPIDQCRLCQELAHAGSFVTPSAILVSAGPAFFTAALAVSPLAVVSLTRAFAWQSRAPPRL